MTASEVRDWKDHPVTKQVFKQLYQRIEQYTERVLANAGANPVEDAKYAGAVMAIRDLLEVEYEEETQ